MKKVEIFCITATALACCAGCGESNKTISDEGQKVISFDLSAKASDILSLDILDEPVVLNLASDSILIGDITQVISYGDRIYLLEGNANAKSIVVTDNTNQAGVRTANG